MNKILEPRRGQLERSLSRRVKDLYRERLGHQPGRVTCRFFDQQINILVENSITQPEQVLTDFGNQKLAEQVRSNINQEMKLYLKMVIEEVIQVPVIDVLIDSEIATGRTSTIAVVATTPEVEDISSDIRQQMGRDRDGDES